jgi:FO synthase
VNAVLEAASEARVADVLSRAEAGNGIERNDALLLWESAELAPLLHAASSLRDRAKGKTVSYSKKVFIPLTHLCRDYCGYCTFRADPKPGVAAYMSHEEVLAVAETGARAGCKEALFSLGDQPERIFPEAHDALRAFGYETTLQYLAAMARLVFEKTGLLPHSNPGVMGAEDLARLREWNVSLGLMLESTSTQLKRAGGAHHRAPDKAPALRLKTIAEAGRQKIAFTTGILVGIGETPEERVESLFALRQLHEAHGHIQEILIQPFRAKGDTRMAAAAEPSIEELQRTLALARLIFGGAMNVQSPPNLVRDDYPQLLAAGINDWGGISPVTKDFINPEAAWPQITMLARRSAEAGHVLRERLAIYPEFALSGDFVDGNIRPGLRKFLGNDGYASDDA